MVDEEARSSSSPAAHRGGLEPVAQSWRDPGFPDQQTRDRRADFIDLRGDNPPAPPASGGSVGDGDSDRFDHIYCRHRWTA